MVLLVDHHAEAVGQEDGGAAPQRVLRVEPRQLLAHQVPLVQQRARRRRQLVQPVHHGLAAGTTRTPPPRAPATARAAARRRARDR